DSGNWPSTAARRTMFPASSSRSSIRADHFLSNAPAAISNIELACRFDDQFRNGNTCGQRGDEQDRSRHVVGLQDSCLGLVGDGNGLMLENWRVDFSWENIADADVVVFLFGSNTDSECRQSELGRIVRRPAQRA